MAIKNENGKFTVSVYKRHPLTRKPVRAQKVVDSYHAAVRAKAQLERDLRKKFDDELLIIKGGKMLYRELLERFYKSLTDRDLALSTIENYRLCLNAHTLKLWGYRPVDSILPDEIRTFIKVTMASKSKSHQKNMAKFIRGVFSYGVEAGHLDKNPVPKFQFRLGNKLKQVLNSTQASLLLRKAKEYNHDWYPHWTAALYTGMRNEELYALDWQNVDLENRLIFVRQTWTKRGGFRDLTKSGDDRVVEIAVPLLTLFKELKLKNTDSAYVLPRIDDGDAGRQAEILRMFLTALSLPQINFHGLRASWATIMLSKGVEAVKVMKMGGWKDLKTLNNHYVRLSGVDIKGVTDKLVFHNPSTEAADVISLFQEEDTDEAAK